LCVPAGLFALRGHRADEVRLRFERSTFFRCQLRVGEDRVQQVLDACGVDDLDELPVPDPVVRRNRSAVGVVRPRGIDCRDRIPVGVEDGDRAIGVDTHVTAGRHRHRNHGFVRRRFVVDQEEEPASAGDRIEHPQRGLPARCVRSQRRRDSPDRLGEY